MKEQLVAIGGIKSNKVEVLRDQKWNEIEPLPLEYDVPLGWDAEYFAFSSLVINTTIYIFGKLI